MLRFALDEMTRPAPNDPAAVFHRFGMATPLWAILGEQPTPDEHAQYQNLLAGSSAHAAGSAALKRAKIIMRPALSRACARYLATGNGSIASAPAFTKSCRNSGVITSIIRAMTI